MGSTILRVMPGSQRIVWLLLAALLLFDSPSCAQFAELNHAAAQITKKLKTARPKMVAVADLTAPDGSMSPQGDYFAWYLSVAVLHYGGKKVPVADHGNFDKVISGLGLTLPGASLSDSLKTLATRARLDVLILGTVERTTEKYSVALQAIRVADGKILDADNVSFARTAFVDSLSDPFPPKTDYPIYRLGDDGISSPSCIRCPDPSYNSLAREQRIQGVSVFQAVVSPEGLIVYAHPVKVLGYGLDEQAYEVIKTWRLKPATNKRHEPVAVIVPIEVTFRMF